MNSKTTLTLLRWSGVRIANITKPTYGMVKSYAVGVILRVLMMTSPMGIVVTEKVEKKMNKETTVIYTVEVTEELRPISMKSLSETIIPVLSSTASRL